MMRAALLAACGSVAILSLSGCVAATDHKGTGQSSAVQSQPSQPQSQARAHLLVRQWNHAALDATGLDHTPLTAGEHRVFGEQLGPTRSSRAMAIVHIAMYEAVNAVVGRYNSYTGLPPDGQASMKAAIAQAAHDALAAMYPSQTPTFDTHLANDLASNNDDNKDEGVALGKNAAASILTLRKNDGSARPEPHVGVDIPETDGPGQWRPDPLNKNTTAVGYYWSQVTPFVLSSADQFRAPPPPDLASDAYAADFAEAASLGGDGVNTPTTRTDEQTQIGVFWAYDGRPSLCAPPKLYNELTMHIADLQGTSSDPMELSRLLVLVNVAMADAAIAVWESKWYYNFWRPVVSIRNTNPSVGGDLNWQPIGAPSSNAVAPNFTPPFPSYPSGHAGFGGALFQVLRDYYGTDDISFDFVSDEFNGTTTDNQGNPRPVVSRHYDSFSQAETENGRSRIYLGIHWNFDATNSIPLGNAVGDLVYNSL